MANRKPTALELALADYQTRVARFSPSYEPAAAATATEIAALALHLQHALAPAFAYAQTVVASINRVTPEGGDADTDGLHDAIDELIRTLFRTADRVAEDAGEMRTSRRAGTVRAGYRHALPTAKPGRAA